MDCIDLFKRAAMALQTDPRYVILDQARKANDKDEELQNLIGEFNLARMDLNNACTIKFKNSDTEYAATMDNISANGFAFLATDNIFTQSKNASVTVTIHDFALPDHNVLEGRIIRCSDDNGLFIVGCQMPEDNFYILEYVEKNLESKK